MIILLFEDDESYVDPESSYALSRRVSGCPSTKFGVRSPLKTQALPATADITLDFGRTPRQWDHLSSLASHTCVLLVNFSTSSNIKFNTSLEATYLLLPADTSMLVHSAFMSFTYSPYKYLIFSYCNLYNYFIQIDLS
jgi:hypothetical protein